LKTYESVTLFSLLGSFFWVTIAAGVRKYPCQITDGAGIRLGQLSCLTLDHVTVTNYYCALCSG